MNYEQRGELTNIFLLNLKDLYNSVGFINYFKSFEGRN